MTEPPFLLLPRASHGSCVDNRYAKEALGLREGNARSTGAVCASSLLSLFAGWARGGWRGVLAFRVIVCVVLH